MKIQRKIGRTTFVDGFSFPDEVDDDDFFMNENEAKEHSSSSTSSAQKKGTTTNGQLRNNNKTPILDHFSTDLTQDRKSVV